MSDESKPQIQQTQSQSAVKKDDKKTPSAGDSAGGRGVKKAPPIAKTNSASPAASAPQNAASSGGGNGGGSNSGASRNTRQPKRTSNATPTGPQARVAADDISRPSSTDGSKRGDNKRRGGGGGNRGNGNGGVQKKTQTNAPTGTRSGGSNAKGANAPASNVSAPESTDSDALSSLQRVITDLKSISPPSTSPSTGNLSSSRSGDFHMPTSASQPFPQPSAGNASSPPQGSNLPVNAPVFQPGAGAYPPQGATELPRHRKSASTGSHGNPNAGSFNNPHFPSALGGFSSQLGSMQEDAEDSLMGGGDFDEGDIPGDGSYPQALNFPRGQAQAHVPMGSFTAPRFAALAAQQQQQQQGQRDDSVGPTGRPQLAPGFMFGARRRGSASNPAPAIAEEDAGFQFPQQQQGFQAESGLGGNVHRRGQSEVPVTGLLAEQVGFFSCPDEYTPIDVVYPDGSSIPDRSPSATAATAPPATDRQRQHGCLVFRPSASGYGTRPSAPSHPKPASSNRYAGQLLRRRLWRHARRQCWCRSRSYGSRNAERAARRSKRTRQETQRERC
jgi:protein SSD1